MNKLHMDVSLQRVGRGWRRTRVRDQKLVGNVTHQHNSNLQMGSESACDETKYGTYKKFDVPWVFRVSRVVHDALKTTELEKIRKERSRSDRSSKTYLDARHYSEGVRQI
jgi:hypothetical protein